MTFELNLEKRDIFGKKLKTSREDGRLPVVVCGKGKESLSFFTDLKEFKRVLKGAGESSIIVLNSGKDKLSALIHDVVIHPISREPIHADFLAVDMSKPICTDVSLSFDGVAPAIKAGLLLVKVLHEIEIEALPKDLPHEIKVDLSKLSAVGDQILVKDIVLPVGVKAVDEPDEVVVSVTAPKEEVETVIERTIEDIEVEKKGKKEEDVVEGSEDKKEGKK